jgi:hypothetical protein
MHNFDPFRRATRRERYKNNFLAVFILGGFLAGGLVAWQSHSQNPESWIVGGMVIGMIVAFVVALIRGETF